MGASSSQILAAIKDLPVPVKSVAYWTVLFRPETYSPERIPTLTECVKLVEKARVQLRGWDFPHLAMREDECNGTVRGSTWTGSWTNFMGNVEYWQLFQSGQFVHFSAVREATEPQWRIKLQREAMSHLQHIHDIDWDAIPGYVSLVNLVYVITEYFEFAARICQAGIYQGDIEIAIGLHGARGFLLTTEWSRVWRQYCRASSNELNKSWRISSEAMVAGSAEHSLKAITWLCECFGWMSPNLEALSHDQQKLLSGRL
jgi:hypothetical protein